MDTDALSSEESSTPTMSTRNKDIFHPLPAVNHVRVDSKEDFGDDLKEPKNEPNKQAKNVNIQVPPVADYQVAPRKYNTVEYFNKLILVQVE